MNTPPSIPRPKGAVAQRGLPPTPSVIRPGGRPLILRPTGVAPQTEDRPNAGSILRRLIRPQEVLLSPPDGFIADDKVLADIRATATTMGGKPPTPFDRQAWRRSVSKGPLREEIDEACTARHSYSARNSRLHGSAPAITAASTQSARRQCVIASAPDEGSPIERISNATDI